MATEAVPKPKEKPPEPQSEPEEKVPEKPKTEAEEQKELLDKIVPNKDNVTVIIGQGEQEITLTQKPLSYFAKIEWFGLLGDTLNRAAQYGGINLTSVIGSPEKRENLLSMTDVQDAEQFLQIILRLVGTAPDFLLESYCIWLGVPRGSRTYAKAIMMLPEDEGGFSDEAGLMVAQTFLDQNAEALRDFILKRLPTLGRRAMKLMQQENKDGSPDTK